MSVRQLNKLVHRQPMFGRCRVFSTSRLWANSVGYGDLWDDEHDCPDHGHFKDDPNKTQAGATLSIVSESYTKYVADDYEKTLTDVDVSLRRHNGKSGRSPVNVGKPEDNSGNSRSATGYD